VLSGLISEVRAHFAFGRGWRLVAPAALALLAACAPPEPLRIGFLGGISGRVADLGLGGRNAATLAVEMRNKAGGIGGRQVELVVEDDQQDVDVARNAFARLAERKVEAIVGPMTSAMAQAVVPLANEAKLLLVSPTVTTTVLSGIDDHFLRVILSTTPYAQKSAGHHLHHQGSRRVAVAYDLRNKAYSESWLADYRQAYENVGGKILVAVGFQSSDEAHFDELAVRLLESSPDAVLLIANSVDAALLAQQLRARQPNLRLNASEWAATERLIELGGKSVEGMTMAQFIDRGSRQPAYLAFRQAYVDRFGHEPGFAGLTAFDATNVVLDGLAARREGQTLKQAILERREFSGAQSSLRFDAAGDASRETYLTVIRDGAFARID
jgi:branched-chain amino acid transport system substrate-binding protein